MLTINEPGAMRAWSAAERAAGHSIALVPTMGSLHDGHMQLVAEARGRAERVVVSIFVNPMQFNRRDDFDRYPRDLDADAALCDTAGVDAIYAPHAAAMYPEGFQTADTSPPRAARRWRPPPPWHRAPRPRRGGAGS